MNSDAVRNSGVQAALVSAVLFGASTPLAKLLLGDLSPWMLAGLLYMGSGLGLGAYRLARRSTRVRLAPHELLPLLGGIISGGVVAPVLLMIGLAGMPASGASLLLNLEGVFTAVLAWVVFRENVDRRVLLGMAAIVAGAAVLSWSGSVDVADPWPSLAVIGACLAWGLDNNLTRKVALNDATWLAAAKGLVAGPVNLALALALGATLPAAGVLLAAMAVGLAVLRGQPGAVHRRASPRRDGPRRGLLLDSTVHRCGDRRHTGRTGDLAARRGRGAHGRRGVAAPDRTPRARTHPSSPHTRALAHPQRRTPRPCPRATRRTRHTTPTQPCSSDCDPPAPALSRQPPPAPLELLRRRVGLWIRAPLPITRSVPPGLSQRGRSRRASRPQRSSVVWRRSRGSNQPAGTRPRYLCPWMPTPVCARPRRP